MQKEYIKREELIAEFKRLELGKNSFIERVFADGVYAIIEQFPAADVAPVVHAKWDANGRCTNCGGHAPFYSMASTYHESPYCFECGAKMDGEREKGAGNE